MIKIMGHTMKWDIKKSDSVVGECSLITNTTLFCSADNGSSKQNHDRKNNRIRVEKEKKRDGMPLVHILG